MTPALGLAQEKQGDESKTDVEWLDFYFLT